MAAKVVEKRRPLVIKGKACNFQIWQRKPG